MTSTLTNQRTVVTVDPRTDERWASLVARSPLASVFHAPPWLAAVARTYGFVPEATILCEGERAVAGMVYSRVDDVRGARLISFPFSDFCDPLAETEADWRAVTSALLSDPAPFTMRTRQSPWPLQDERLHAEQIGYWHAVDIAEDEPTQWGRMDRSARKNITRARESGVEVSIGSTSEDMRAFFELHLQIRKYKYRLLAQPWPFFENVLSAFAPEQRLHVILLRFQGRSIGGGVVIAWGDTLYLKFSASALDELEVRPNDMLAWETFGLARRLGLRRMDYGFSDEDQPGLLRYKRKFATVEVPVQRVTRGSPSQTESARTLGRSLTGLTALLTEDGVPDDLTEAAGSVLYRYFV